VPAQQRKQHSSHGRGSSHTWQQHGGGEGHRGRGVGADRIKTLGSESRSWGVRWTCPSSRRFSLVSHACVMFQGGVAFFFGCTCVRERSFRSVSILCGVSVP